jgi:hypothetical protein
MPLWVLGAVGAVVTTRVLTAGPESWFRSGWLARFLWGFDTLITSIPFVIRLPYHARLVYLALIGTLILVPLLMMLNHMFLRGLLSWKGWLHTTPGKISKTVMIWGGFIKLFRGSRPLTFSLQSTLPRLPVPSLSDTIRVYLASLKPLLSDEDYAARAQSAAEFANGSGPKLNNLLRLKWLFTDNYITDWWGERSTSTALFSP